MATRWRWLIPALAALSITLGALPAKAAWTYEPVKWRRQNNATGYNGGVYGIPTTVPFDTTYASAAAARVDTTAEWNMLDAEPPAAVSGSATTADSTQVAAVVVAGDSTVASTFAWAATTVTVQVNYGQSNTGWTTVGAAISPLGTTTQKAILAPLFTTPVGTAHIGSTTFNAAFNIFAPRCRALVTWGTAAAVPMARVYVRKWVAAGSVNIAVDQLLQGAR
jgi:hypothetical protein